MINNFLKITFQLVIFLVALFFLSLLTGFVSVADLIAILNIDPTSNAGKAVSNVLLELKLVTKNLFGLIFEIV
jgi:hypothetical protein